MLSERFRSAFSLWLSITVIYILLWQLSQLYLPYSSTQAVSIFYPIPAFTLALSFHYGIRVLPIVYVAIISSSIFTHPFWGDNFTLFNYLHSLRQATVYVVAGYGLRRRLKNASFTFANPKQLWTFFIITFSSAMVAALLASALFYGYGFTPLDATISVLLSFFIGDFTGLLLFTPIAFAWVQRRQNINVEYVKRSCAQLPVMAMLSCLVMSGAILTLTIYSQYLARFHYLLLIPTVLISARYGIQVAILSALAVNILTATFYVNLIHSPLSITEIQVLLSVTMSISFLVGYYYEEHQQINDKLLRNQATLSSLARHASLNEISATLAHEIASPLQTALTNCQLSTQLLANDEPPNTNLLLILNQDIAFALDKAIHIHQRLNNNIAKHDRINIDTVQLTECIDDAIHLLGSLINQSQAKVTIASHVLPLQIQADKLSMTQVMINVIKNAIQAEATQIDFSASVVSDQLQLMITNNGKPIKPQHVEGIFQSFYSTKKDSVGLGLSICRTLLESFGGNMALLNSDHERTTFLVTLPMAD